MTTPLTDQERAEMKRLAEAANSGTWIIQGLGQISIASVIAGGHTRLIANLARYNDLTIAAFIAAANPTAVLSLLAEIEELRGKQRTEATHERGNLCGRESEHWKNCGTDTDDDDEISCPIRNAKAIRAAQLGVG